MPHQNGHMKAGEAVRGTEHVPAGEAQPGGGVSSSRMFSTRDMNEDDPQSRSGACCISDILSCFPLLI